MYLYLEVSLGNLKNNAMHSISFDNMWIDVYYSCLFDKMLPKRTSKRKKKAAPTSGIARNKETWGDIHSFLNQETILRYSDIISHWTLLAKRLIKLEEFLGFEIVTLVQNCGWEKVIKRPHLMYERLVQEFNSNSNFNSELDTLGPQHKHHTWVADKWIMFSPEVIHEYDQLPWDNVVPILDNFHWNDVRDVLFGWKNSWPL